MSEGLGPVVAVERRGQFELGRLVGEGTRRVRVEFADGQVLRLTRDHVLHRFEHELPHAGETSRALERWRTARSEGDDSPIDLDLLWSDLDEPGGYRLSELARRWYSKDGDGEVYGVLMALRERALEYTSESGCVRRVDAETVQRIREREARESRLQEENARLLAWFKDATPPERPDEDLCEIWDGLCNVALKGGSRSSRRYRGLMREFGHETSDDLLEDLCRRGWLPEHVNELPRRSAVPTGYPQEVKQRTEELRAAAASRAQGLSAEGREDFRGAPTLTIDQPWTRDPDDAISLIDSERGQEVAVHICDVTAFVTPGGPLDREARRRGTTIYFRLEALSMFPEVFVEEVAALLPEVDRYALSVVFPINEGADEPVFGAPRIVRSVVRVTDRLSYADTESSDGRREPMLARLAELAARLRAERVEAGARPGTHHEAMIDIDGPEVRFHYVENTTRGHLIVSELMLRYNAAIGGKLAEHGLPALFRTQTRRLDPPPALPHPALARLLVRFPPTRTGLKPGPHRTIGVPAYVQATAPIRRYTDLVTQFQMSSWLQGREPVFSEDDLKSLKREQEKLQSRARRLEDQRLQYWKHRALRTDPGPRPAVVSRTFPDGRVYAWLPPLQLERRLHNLPVDHELRPGDEILVLASEIEPRRRSVKLELFEDPL